MARLPLLCALAVLGLPATGAAAAAAEDPPEAPMLTAPYGKASEARLRLGALDPAHYRVVRRPSPSTVVVHYPPVRHCATTTLRLRTVADRRDPETWVRENTPSSLAFETLTTATVPTATGATETRVVGAMRLFAGIVNSSLLTERAVSVARLRSGRLAILTQTSHTLDLAKRPGTACGGTNSFSIGPAFAEIRIAFPAAVSRTR
jgi:hypothetical protein